MEMTDDEWLLKAERRGPTSGGHWNLHRKKRTRRAMIHVYTYFTTHYLTLADVISSLLTSLRFLSNLIVPHLIFMSIVIVIVISRFLKRYLKAKRTRTLAYSRALRRIKGGFPKGDQEKLRSDFQNTMRGQSSC